MRSADYGAEARTFRRVGSALVCPAPVMDALAFLSATELAARIRARSVQRPRGRRGGSSARIEAIDPQLGAFVELDAERAVAEADAIPPRRPAPVRRRADRGQGEHGRGRVCA